MLRLSRRVTPKRLMSGTILKDFKKEFNFHKTNLEKMSHREYTDASLIKPAGADSVYIDRENSEGDYVTVGHVEAKYFRRVLNR